MAHNLNTIKNAPGIITKMAAGALVDKLQFCKSIAKADEDDFNGKNGFKAGDTIYISKPARFIPQTTFDITSSKQDVVEGKEPLTLDIISTVGVELDSFDFATEIDIKNMFKRVVEPAVQAIAQDVESRMLEKAVDATYNIVGTPGSTSFSPATVLKARTRLNKMLAPKDSNRYFLHESEAGESAVDSRKGLFQSSEKIAQQYEQGFVGLADGFTWLENELLPTHTNGNDVTFVVDGTVSTEGTTTIHVDGLTTTTGTVTKGTIFTVDGVYAVHPQTKEQYTFLQPFVVTADVTADGTGDADLSVSPALYTSASNGLQNISGFPQDNDTTSVLTGSASTGYLQNLVFHRDAFKMASVPLIMPKNAEVAEQETFEGITVALVRDFDVDTRSMITRLDFLGAICAPRAEWACRITG